MAIMLSVPKSVSSIEFTSEMINPYELQKESINEKIGISGHII